MLFRRYTWDFWARIYERKLGGLRASTTQHKPLPTKAPEDYEAPYQGTGPAVGARSLSIRCANVRRTAGNSAAA